MVRKKVIITLIGTKQAKQGFAFIHQGINPECEDCAYFQVCINNLEPQRVYIIVGVRGKKLSCKLHESGVQVVEVLESEISTTLRTESAVEGAVITFQHRECNLQTCQHYELCVPRGLVDGDRCVIQEVRKKVVCLKKLSLVEAVLQRLTAT